MKKRKVIDTFEYNIKRRKKQHIIGQLPSVKGIAKGIVLATWHYLVSESMLNKIVTFKYITIDAKLVNF